ncbi:MAG: hypothetical protein JNM85_06685 [Chthonomonas sp.]|nr:hypothetical protein [Chthonomonas sp.]
MMFQPVYVYIASNSVGALHIGTSRNLLVTMRQFKERSVVPAGWVLGVDQLLFVRQCMTLDEALRLESSLRHMGRKTLQRLIRFDNPAMLDLSRPWYVVKVGENGPDYIENRMPNYVAHEIAATQALLN